MAARSKRPRASALAEIRANRHAKAMSHEPSAMSFSRRCRYCHGKKSYTKTRGPCCLCHGTGVVPVETKDRLVYETLLAALRMLTTPACHEASTRELFAFIKRTGYVGTLESIAHILASLCRQGFITKRRFNSETMWSSTPPVGAIHESPTKGHHGSR